MKQVVVASETTLLSVIDLIGRRLVSGCGVSFWIQHLSMALKVSDSDDVGSGMRLAVRSGMVRRIRRDELNRLALVVRLRTLKTRHWIALIATMGVGTMAFMLLKQPPPLPESTCNGRSTQLLEWGRRLPGEFDPPHLSIGPELANVPFDVGWVDYAPVLVLQGNKISIDGRFPSASSSMKTLNGDLLAELNSEAAAYLRAWKSGDGEYTRMPSITLAIARDVSWRDVARVLNTLPRTELRRVDFAVIREAVRPPQHSSMFDAWVVNRICDDSLTYEAPTFSMIRRLLPDCAPAMLILKAGQERCHVGLWEETRAAETLSELYSSCRCAIDEDRLRALLWRYYRMDEEAERTWYVIRVGGRATIAEEGSPARPVSFRGDAKWNDVAASLMQVLEEADGQPIRAFVDGG